jgi:hypothetical protein
MMYTLYLIENTARGAYSEASTPVAQIGISDHVNMTPIQIQIVIAMLFMHKLNPTGANATM